MRNYSVIENIQKSDIRKKWRMTESYPQVPKYNGNIRHRETTSLHKLVLDPDRDWQFINRDLMEDGMAHGSLPLILSEYSD